MTRLSKEKRLELGRRYAEKEISLDEVRTLQKLLMTVGRTL